MLCFAASVLWCLLPETKDAPTLEVLASVNTNSSEDVENKEEQLEEAGEIGKAVDSKL